MCGESSPGDKRILKPTIPGSQGQASSLPIAQIMFSLINNNLVIFTLKLNDCDYT